MAGDDAQLVVEWDRVACGAGDFHCHWYYQLLCRLSSSKALLVMFIQKLHAGHEL